MNTGPRRFVIGLAGALGGTVIGLMVTFGIIMLWEVLKLPPPNDDPKDGLTMLLYMGPVLMLIGGSGGALWLLGRDRAGGSVTWPLGAVGVFLAVTVAYLIMLTMI